MKLEQLYFYIKDFVDKNANKNTDIVASEFENNISKFSDKDFMYLLLFAGFIPDLYSADSSEETLYSKLVEVLVCMWARRLGFDSRYIKQKASYEDVYLEKNGHVIVCDAKSFRLGRSQKAPNVKDFIKPEDIRKWLNRYGTKKLGGLVTYPDTHEWTTDSDAYQYCSTKEIPTIMLPYKYMALILQYKEKLKTNNILSLWDYDNIFPVKLKKGEKNKKKYWEGINGEMLKILNISDKEFYKCLTKYDSEIQKFIKYYIEKLKNLKKETENNIRNDINKISTTEMIKQYTEYRIYTETKALNDTIKRISDFRITPSD